MNFGELCKEKRLNRGIPMRQFCRLLNVDPSNWSKVELGIASPPSIEKIKRICDILHINEPDRTGFFLIAQLHNIQFEQSESVLDKLPIFISKKANLEKLYKLLLDS